MATNEVQTTSGQWESDVHKGGIRVILWTIAWILSMAVLNIGAKYLWDFSIPITLVMVLINVFVGIGMILANVRLLKVQDEMQQRIFLEAAALTAGVTLVFSGSYQNWEDLRLISFEPQVWHVISLMGLSHIVGTIAAIRRYR